MHPDAHEEHGLHAHLAEEPKVGGTGMVGLLGFLPNLRQQADRADGDEEDGPIEGEGQNERHPDPNDVLIEAEEVIGKAGARDGDGQE